MLYSLVNKRLSKKKGKLYVAFVDLTKAFDLVKRTKLWEVLLKIGVKGKLFKSLQGMYKTVKACVRASEGLTEYFDCPSGLKKGCTASPILFSLFIDGFSTLVKNTDIRGVQLFPELTEILLLMFADDLALISDTVRGLQKLLNFLYKFCSDKGLIINIPKTVVMVFKNGGGLARTETWTLDAIRLKVVLLYLRRCKIYKTIIFNTVGKIPSN